MNDYVVRINDKTKNISVKNNNILDIDGKNFNYELLDLNCNSFLLKLNDSFYEISCSESDGENLSLVINGINFDTIVRSSLQEKAIRLIEEASTSVHHKTEVKAPMPGMILNIKKSVGDNINQGESVVILEAMKMENDIKSPTSGVIKSVQVSEGAAVEKGMILFSIE
jgi:biotin carboxyl carrier protein